MDDSLHEQGSNMQQNPKGFLVSLASLASLIKRLADLIKVTEEEKENAGIYIDRLGEE